jgi:hypothetical protein
MGEVRAKATMMSLLVREALENALNSKTPQRRSTFARLMSCFRFLWMTCKLGRRRIRSIM